MRHPPRPPDPELLAKIKKRTPEDSGWKTYACKLVTPMYGGGVRPGEVDAEMPIRVTAIRGQLRYWWRLLNQDKYQDLKALFETERAIWGGLGQAESLAKSKVALHTENHSQPKLETCADFRPRGDGSYPSMPNWRDWAKPYAYALFPGQGKLSGDKRSIETPPATLVREGLAWDLCINTMELSADEASSVAQAVRWWATFGGIGARTRRGLGAIEVKEKNTGHILRVSEKEVATLKEFALSTRPPVKSAMEAWQHALTALRDFRQGVEVGRNKGEQNPGRSRWPEPAAIRKITGQHRVKADGTKFDPGAAPLLFPRAAFGLPIIFHFQGKQSDQKPDPGDSELVPIVDGQRQERMASPLILRPYVNEQGKWHPALLRLPYSHLWDMDLQLSTSKGGKKNQPNELPQGGWWPRSPEQGKETAKGIKPMSGRGGDALTAFMAYFVHPSGPAKSASDSVEKPHQEAQEERWEKAQIKFNQGNGSITVIGPNNRTAMALGDAGRAIWTSLSPQAQQKIRNGFFKTTVLIKGNEIVKVQE